MREVAGATSAGGIGICVKIYQEAQALEELALDWGILGLD